MNTNMAGAGGHIFDCCCLAILIATSVALSLVVQPSYIYYFLRDVSNEFLKMSVIVASFEIADQVVGIANK